jgi:Zinc carboxypeptidase
MPPAVPIRPANYGYHFHAYDFAGSAANPPWGLSPPQISRGGWQFYSLRRDLNNLLAVGLARGIPNITLNGLPGLAPFAQTTGGKQTLMLSLGNQANAPAIQTVVITGGIHAREWIAAEIAYLIAEYLVVNYPDPAAPLPLTPKQGFIQHLVDTRYIHIIPMLNPGGNDRTVFSAIASARMWRKNLRLLPSTPQGWVQAFTGGGGANPPPFQDVSPTYGLLRWASYDVPDYDPAHNIPPGGPGNNPNYRGRMLYENEIGVDLNRNMDTPAWGYDCPPDYNNNAPEGETFFGTGRGGEPESGNVQAAMIAAAAAGVGGNIDVAIDYHSYGRMILYPSELPPGGYAPGHQELGRLLKALIVDNAHQDYRLGTGPGLIRYEANGTVADRALRSHQARSFTIELDPASGDPAGFQLNENQIQNVFETNILGALAAIAGPTTVQGSLNLGADLVTWAVHGAGNQLP